MELGYLNIPKTQLTVTDTDIEKSLFSRMNLYLQYSKIISTEKYAADIVQKIESDTRVQALEGKMVCNGFTASRFDIKFLAMWYLWAINEYGPQVAEANLDKYLSLEKVPVINAMWVLGIELDRIIKLANGVEIIPVEEMPFSTEKEEYLKDEINIFCRRENKPKAAIIYRTEVKKIDDDSDVLKFSRATTPFEKSNELLQEISCLLNAVEGISCTPFSSASYPIQEMPFGIFGGASIGHYSIDVMGYRSSKLSESNIVEIDTLLESYNKLSMENKNRINRVLSRLSQAKRRTQIEDKMLDLGIALEMVLLDDNGNNDQLKLMFRLRGSWIIGNSYEERRVVDKQLKEIYTFRSQVAHTGILKGNAEVIRGIEDNFQSYANLAEKIIRQVIYLGKPDWSKMILGGS